MTIKECWNFIEREPFVTITWELDFSRACSFRTILMNHNNFRFARIPDKNNNVIFLKSPKTLFFGYFWPFLGHFCPMGLFSKRSGPVTHNFIWAPNTMLSFKKKLMSQFRENLRTDGRWMEGRTEGQTDWPNFIGPFRPRPGVQKLHFWLKY